MYTDVLKKSPKYNAVFAELNKNTFGELGFLSNRFTTPIPSFTPTSKSRLEKLQDLIYGDRTVRLFLEGVQYTPLLVQTRTVKHYDIKLSNNVLNYMVGLIDSGMDPITAAGFAGNAHVESNGDLKAVGDGGTSVGLMQWHADRKERMKHRYKENMYTVASAIDYTNWELKNGERHAAQKIASAENTPAAKAKAISLHYERPKTEDSDELRLSCAEQYYEWYLNQYGKE